MTSNKPIIVLRDKRWLSSGLSPLTIVLLLSAFTFLLIVYMATTIFPNANWGQLWSIFIEFIGSIDWSHVGWANTVINLAIFGLFCGQILYITKAQKLERLTLSPDGIKYTSPLPFYLKQFKSDWFLPWEQVKKAELGARYNRLVRPEFAQLTLSTSSESRQLFPVLWVDPEHFTRPSLRCKFVITPTTQTHEEILKSVRESEVIRYVSKTLPDLIIDSNFSKAIESSSLEKNPHGRIAMVIIFTLLAYAIIDFIVGPDSYAEDPSSLTLIFITSGMLGVILSGMWLFKCTLGVAEKSGLAMLIGIVVSFAMIPGALRINAMTGANDEIPAEYFVTHDKNGVLLKPVVAGMPVIDYFANNQYWDRYGKDDIYPVHLHRGVLGFYQFNSKEIVDEIHDYNSSSK